MPWLALASVAWGQAPAGYITQEDLALERIADYYAAAWSFVYFLKESEAARQHPRWSRILDDYFLALKRFHQESKGAVSVTPDTGSPVPGATARARALELVLTGLDIPELEAAWRKFIAGLKDS